MEEGELRNMDNKEYSDILKRQEYLRVFQKEVYEILNKCIDTNEKLIYLQNRLILLFKTKMAALSKIEIKSSLDHIDLIDSDNTLIQGAIDFIQKLISEHEKLIQLESKSIEIHKSNRIKWVGSSSVFGYLFIELVNNGFIEMPLRNGEVNYSAFSRQLMNAFDVPSTEGNLANECNPNKNSLSLVKRNKFSIPRISDLK
jgi:hypothetical protein